MSDNNLATPTRKNTNWIYIGGIIVASYYLYKYFKR